MVLEFRILGSLQVYGESGAVALGGIKLRVVLAVLLLHANESVRAEHLALALWGQDAPASAAKSVQVYVSRLRKALGDRRILVTTPAGYCLRVGADELDAVRFARLVEDGRRALEAGQAERAAGVLREALGLWRGPPLAELAFEAFAQSEIARLEEQRLDAVELRVDADLAAGRHGELVGELRQLVAAHPTRERLAGQLMLALYRRGQQVDALEVFHAARRVLLTQVGVEPGPQLRRLHEAILAHDPTLEHGQAVVELPREPGGAMLVSRGAAQDRAATAASGDGGGGLFALPSALAVGASEVLVGRAIDVEWLNGVFGEVAGGGRWLVALCGEPGIGKTRLAAEVALRAHGEGAIVLYGRCDQEALLALQPFVEALRHYVSASSPAELAERLQVISGELRRIVPELADRIADLPQPLAGDPEGARSRLFEAVSALLCDAAQRTPVVLVLEDLHWADSATLLLLKYLMRYPRQARLMVLATYRQTELDLDHPLSRTLAELSRERLLQRRALAPLDAAAVSQLVGFHTGQKASPQLRQLVYERTGGNALFVIEVLRDLDECRAISDAGCPLVPEGVKDVIGQRLARLGSNTIGLLTMGAVLGGQFELDVLEHVSELREDELVDALESAVRARVIEEVAGAAGRFMFSHALIRETLYGQLTVTRRALLHRRAGTALEQAHDAALEAHLAELAYHFAQARSSAHVDKAIQYGTRAGEYAISQLAYEQGAAHFRQTVQLIDAANADQCQGRRCDLVIARGEAERQAGDPTYRQTLLDAARLAQDLHDRDRLARAALANNRGRFSSAQGVDRDRVAVLRAALDACGDADSPTRAALLALLAVELFWDEDWRLRHKLADDAVAIARRLGDPQTLALVLTQRGLAQWTPQTLPERRADLREASQLAEQLDDPLLAGHAASLGAQTAMEAGDLEHADRLLARLSAVAEQLAQPLMRWYAGLARAKRYAISGPVEEAERLAFAALELGRSAEQPDGMLWFGGQLYVARFLQGALDRGDPHVPDLFETPSSSMPTGPEIIPSRSLSLLLGAGMSAILCEVGRLDDARAHFDLLMNSELDELPNDITALGIPALASLACAHLADTRSATRLHAILKPHSQRLVNAGSSWLGATTHYLGLLAATLDRPDEADARFAAAERSYTSLDAKPWLARLYSDWAATLRTGQRHDNDRRAEQLLERAATYRHLA